MFHSLYNYRIMSQVWKILTPLRILPYPKWEPPAWWDPEDYEEDED